MLASVHRRPPPFANCANTIRPNIGERPRTGMNETETETGRAAAHAEPAEGHDRQPSRGDEARDGDVEVANVVVQRRAELLDLIFANADLAAADAELEEAVGEVADEEDHGISDEGGSPERHQPGPEPERGRFHPLDR